MKRFVGALFILLLLGSPISCKWGEGEGSVFDFVADPMAPPIPNQPTGSYDDPIMMGLEPGGNDSGAAYYTLDPDIPMAMDETWQSYLWQKDYQNPPIVIQSPSTLRIFSARDEFHFSAVANHEYTFTSTVPELQPLPGAQYKATNIWANIHNLMLAVEISTGKWDRVSQGAPEIYFSYSRSLTVEPADPDPLSAVTAWTGPGDTVRWFDNTQNPYLNATNPELWIKVMTRIPSGLAATFPGWTDSPIVEGQYWYKAPAASGTLGMTVLLPGGTEVSLGSYTMTDLVYGDPSGDLTVTASPGMASYSWYLNGTLVSGASGDQIVVGDSGPTGYPYGNGTTSGCLPIGAYLLSCVALDSSGYEHSASLEFRVVNAP